MKYTSRSFTVPLHTTLYQVPATILYFYGFLILANSVSTIMLTMDQSTDRTTAIIILDATCDAFYGTFPLIYLVLQYVYLHTVIPVDGAFASFNNVQRTRLLLSDARLVSFTGSGWRVTQRITSRLFMLFLAVRGFRRHCSFRHELRYKIEHIKRIKSAKNVLDARLKQVDANASRRKKAASLYSIGKGALHVDHNAGSVLDSNPVLSESTALRIGYKKVPLSVSIAFILITASLVLYSWVRIATVRCPITPGHWISQVRKVNTFKW